MHLRTSIMLLLCHVALAILAGSSNGQSHSSSKAKARIPDKSHSRTASEFEVWLSKREERDVLFFKEEKYPPTEVKIEKVQGDQMLVSRGSQQRTFKIEEIQAIQWHHQEDDDLRIKSASITFLRDACEFQAPIYHLLDHSEEAWLLAYLFRLLTSHSGLDHAVEIQTASKRLNADSKDLKEFANEVLKYRSTRILPSDSKLTPEVAEAKHFIESGQRLPIFMMIHYLAQLAVVEDQARKELETEHPKWRDDEEIKPIRQRHFQLAMDMNLYPYLFESHQEEAASLGLLRAGKIAHEAGEIQVARRVWSDLVSTYAQSSVFSETQRLLANLPQPEAIPDVSKNEAAIPEKPSDEPPPKFLRFNLFEE